MRERYACHVPKCGHDIAEGTLLAMTLTRSMFFPIEQQLFSVVESLAMTAMRKCGIVKVITFISV